jgi:hypothetical protein
MRETALWDAYPFGSLPHARFLMVTATPLELRSRTVLGDNCARGRMATSAKPCLPGQLSDDPGQPLRESGVE